MTFEQMQSKIYYLKQHKAYNNGNLDIMKEVKIECSKLLDLINDAFETGFYVGEQYKMLWDFKNDLTNLINSCSRFLGFNIV